MRYDYMCNDCGLEYTVTTAYGKEPELSCPACKCTDGVPILPYDEETNELEGWDTN